MHFCMMFKKGTFCQVEKIFFFMLHVLLLFLHVFSVGHSFCVFIFFCHGRNLFFFFYNEVYMHFCMMFKKGTFCPVRNMFFFTLVFNNVNKCMHKPNACTSKNSLKKTQKKKARK